MEENVLVIPRSLFDRLGDFQGFCPDVAAYFPGLLEGGEAKFLARSLAENDPSFKQIIPYAVLRWNGKILRYFRGQASGEKRLVAKASIGIGGHINDGDLISDCQKIGQEIGPATSSRSAPLRAGDSSVAPREGSGGGLVDLPAYRRAVEREVAEEIRFAGKFTDRIAGVLNDDSTEVGRVHLGVVHVFDLDSHEVASGESALHDFAFLSPCELRAERDRLETWSQILVDAPGFLESAPW